MIKWCLVTSVCLSAAAQGPVYRLGPDVTPPFVVKKPMPSYTDEARLAKLEGSVLLSLVVGAGGQPREIHVARSLGLGLDESAVENVRTWQFKPGTRNGTPVDVLVNEEVFFRPQRTLWDWHAVRAAFRPPGEAIRPVLLKAKYPPTIEFEENASVTITFNIGRDGVPANVRVLKSSDPRWDSDLLRVVRVGWRFRPATLDGKPVVAGTWFEFVRGSHSPIPPLPFPPPESR